MTMRLAARDTSAEQADQVAESPRHRTVRLGPTPRSPPTADRRQAVRLVSAALVLLVAASALAPAGEDERSTAGGDRAVRYFDALARAYADDDVYRVLDFYAPGTHVNMSRGDFTGGLVTDMFRRGPVVERELTSVYLGDEAALTLVRWPESERRGAVEVLLDDGLIGGETVFDEAASLARGLRASPDVIDHYEALYRDYAQAWSSDDPGRVGPLYAPDAALSEVISGTGSVTGRAAIADLVAGPSTLWTPVSIGAISGQHTDGAEGSGLYLGPTTYGRDPGIAVGVYDVGSDDDCALRVAVRWLLIDGLIVDEHRYAEVESLRRCRIGALADGWWTDLELPGPRDEVVTGTIDDRGRRIVVHNGTHRLVAVVEWALGRFEAAGLATPRIESVTFEPSRQCADRSGRLVHVDGSSELFLCLLERDLCSGRDRCDRAALNVRLAVLHELGHAWLLDHVDGSVQAELLEVTGTATWDDRDTPWQRRGSEYAAEVLAWGLLDELVPMVRIGAPPCSTLAGVFELITEREPLVDVTACPQGALSAGG